MNWNYNQANYNEQSYNLLNQGNYKVRIMSVRETIAKNGSQQQKKQVTVDTVSTYSDFEFSIMETSKEYKRNRKLAPVTIINKKMKFKKET